MKFISNIYKLGLQLLIRHLIVFHTGLEASITEPEANAIRIKNSKIVVESQEDTSMQVSFHECQL